MSLADHRAAVHTSAPFLFGILGIVVALVLAGVLPGYFVYLGITVVVSTIAIMGLGIVSGSAGMIALCQLTFAAVGAWIVAGLSYLSTDAGAHMDSTGFLGGYIVWLILGGLGAGLVGVLVGLPALRLRGVNLAVVTLAFAAAADTTLVMIQFPGSATGVSVDRPSFAQSDEGFFVFSTVVLVVVAIAMYFLQHGRWGSAWKAIAFSERGTAAVGQSVARAKLSAFAVSAAFGGIAGGLIAGQVGLPFASSFTSLQSLALYVLAIMSGTYLIDMAVFGGILWVAVPELLKDWGVDQNWGFVIFGVLGVQALTTNTNLGEIIRGAWWNRRARRHLASSQGAVHRAGHGSEAAAASNPVPPLAERATLLEVTSLVVPFGSVKALDGVSVTLPEHTIMGLIGPNGAGKSTFVDALTGFLPHHTGTITLSGRPLKGLGATERARLGLRRTFQQDRVPPTLTIGGYIRFVARRKVADADVAEVLEFLGCPPPNHRLSIVDTGTRRLIEVAANLLSRPKVLLLDEPAAGLSHDEHVTFGERLREVPARFGISLVLIEHDLEMVRSVCDVITVLDFGHVVASGPKDEVLENPEVLKAYMGDAELA